MKLRSIICASAVSAAMAASALETSNTFARMPVEGGSGYTLLGIPLAGCGESSSAIYVTNLVMTTGLANGTKLLYKDGNSIYAWQISGGNWVALDTSTTVAGLTATPSAGSTALPCGKGCWLYLASSATVYMFGQVNEGASMNVTVPGADTATDVRYTLVSRPYEKTAFDIRTIAGAAGDTVIIPDSTNTKTGQTTYTFRVPTAGGDACWTKEVAGAASGGRKGGTTITHVALTANEVTIPAGIAFMYGRKGTSGLTITFNK